MKDGCDDPSVDVKVAGHAVLTKWRKVKGAMSCTIPAIDIRYPRRYKVVEI